MTSSRTDTFRNDGAAVRSTQLPLLSFIITNFNYGRFVERCLQSILEQTYPNIECIIVDDASTDASREIIEHLVERHANVRCLFNEANLGQTRSCIAGFQLTRGAYIALIDADDVVLPDFAMAHVWTHLSSREPIGFTSSDMVVCVNEQIVLTTCFTEGNFENNASWLKESDLHTLPDLVKPTFGVLEPFQLRRVHNTNRIFVWGSTSSAVYRRDAIMLFFDNDRIGKLKFATDAYLYFGINSLCGSIIIDHAFSIYHVHGQNNFTTSAMLCSMKTYTEEDDFGAFAAYCALEHIARNLGAFSRRSHSLRHLFRAMKTLARRSQQSSGLDHAKVLLVAVVRLLWLLILPGLRPTRR